MPASPTAQLRLRNQQLAAARFTRAEEVVRWFGAVQAQDGPAALWAIGQRVVDATEDDVEAAVAARRIVRTWPMRGTLHYVAAEDARWMLRLLAPRVVRRAASRYRQLELDTAAFTRSRRVLEKALRGGKCVTRAEAYARLEAGGVRTGEQRGIHILGWLAMQRHLCFGPRRGKQPTFVLLEEWLPPADDPSADEALGRLAARYFQSHAPATAADFAWWTGLPLGEARRALAAAGIAPDAPARGARERVPAPLVALLPPWDEYLVAYRDRGDAFGHLPAGANPIGIPVLLVDGRVQGAWTRRVTPSAVHLDVEPWAPLGARERRALARAAERYARFLGRELELRISSSGSRRSP